MITNFGGTLEGAEEPVDAIIREIQEELSINLNQEDLTLLTSSIRTSSLSNEPHRTHLFVARNIEKRDLILREGKEIVYLGMNKSLDLLNLSPGTKEVLMKFRNGVLETQRGGALR